MSKELGNKLSFLRSNSGLTQSQIAKKLNVDRSTYSNYERAITEPDIKTLNILADIFSVDLNYLLSNKNETRKVADPIGICTYDKTEQEQNLLISFRLLTPKNQAKLLKTADSLYKKQEKEN